MTTATAGSESQIFKIATQDAGTGVADRIRITNANLYLTSQTTTSNATVFSIAAYQNGYPATGQYGSIDFVNGSPWYSGGSIVFKTNGNADITNTSPTERMRITSAGNVGIGTSSPANIGAGYPHLEVNGSITGVISVSAGGVRGLTLSADNSAASVQARVSGQPLLFLTNGGAGVTERMRITSDGQLIVGTTATGTGANSARIYGYATNSTHNGAAIYGYNAGGAYPGVGTTRYGVRGETYGYASGSIYGVYGYATDDAVSNTTQYGVYGESGPAIYSPGYGVYAKATHNPAASQNGYALFANMNTTGTGSAATTYGARIENNSTAGQTNFGLYVYSATGATTTVPLAIAAGGSERARFSSAGGFSVGTTADPGAGAIYATGNITAYYSDARLKDVKGTIANALDKVSSLSGVYYTNNEVAVAHGYTSAETQVGLLAQDVEAVLPEVVKAAPFDLDERGDSKSGEHYKTVQYDRIIPLLVEAIKELRAEVKALRG